MGKLKRKEITFPIDEYSMLERMTKKAGHKNISDMVRFAVKQYGESLGFELDLTVSAGNPTLLEQRNRLDRSN